MTPGFGHVSKALVTAYGQGTSDCILHLSLPIRVSGSQAFTQTFVTDYESVKDKRQMDQSNTSPSQRRWVFVMEPNAASTAKPA